MNSISNSIIRCFTLTAILLFFITTKRVVDAQEPERGTNFTSECGYIDRGFLRDDVYRSRESRSLIPGQWPWLAGVFRIENSKSYFQCSGTLISLVGIATSAECVHKCTGEVFQPDEIEIYLGQDNLNNRTAGLTYAVQKIEVHPGYDPTKSRIVDNIAIILLKEGLVETKYIIPVCLTFRKVFKNDTGFVGGWNDKDPDAPPNLMFSFPYSGECYERDPLLHTMSSNISFCAGDDLYEGSCSTNRGSGFLIWSEVWLFRGILLYGVGNSGNVCTSDSYFVYLDTRTYFYWMQDVQRNILIPFIIAGINSTLEEGPLEYAQNISHSDCGELNPNLTAKPLIFGGEAIDRGAWPWLAAIFKYQEGTLSFQCGGTLVSRKAVISAAHCFNTRNGFLQRNEVQLYLGLHDIGNITQEGAVKANIKTIFLHPDYNQTAITADGDIAMVIFSDQVMLSDYIHYACIFDVSLSVAGYDGYVVGWGRFGQESDQRLSKTPHGITVPIVTNADCVKSNPFFQIISSNRTLCAGNNNGTGPCQADSGSGLMLRSPPGFWFLRAVVSLSLGHNIEYCDLKSYVVYADVPKYLKWIQSVIEY